MAAIHDQLELWVGDEWAIEISCFDSDGVTPLNISTATAFLWQLLAEDTGLVVLSRANSTTPQITIVDATNGIVVIVIDASITGTIPAGFYQDRFTVTFPNNAVTRQVEGPIAVFS
jgi:hypothetical protein